MPDSAKQPTPDDPSKSHTQLKAAVPHDQQKASQLTVQMGTHEHRALLEEVPVNETEQLPERRRSPGMTTVINPPPSGGLFGTWSSVGNMSAIAVMMGAFVWFIVTARSDARERWLQDREDRSTERSQNQAAFAAMAGTLTGISSRNDVRDVKIDTAVDEIRRAVSEQKHVNMEILTVLKAIRDAKNEEMGRAPMPRSRTGKQDGDGAVTDTDVIPNPPFANAHYVEGVRERRGLALEQERVSVRVSVFPDNAVRGGAVTLGEQ